VKAAMDDTSASMDDTSASMDDTSAQSQADENSKGVAPSNAGVVRKSAVVWFRDGRYSPNELKQATIDGNLDSFITGKWFDTFMDAQQFYSQQFRARDAEAGIRFYDGRGLVLDEYYKRDIDDEIETRMAYLDDWRTEQLKLMQTSDPSPVQQNTNSAPAQDKQQQQQQQEQQDESSGTVSDSGILGKLQTENTANRWKVWMGEGGYEWMEGVEVTIVSVQVAEAFYACRHTVAAAPSDRGDNLNNNEPAVAQRMLSTWHEDEHTVVGAERWRLQMMSDGNIAISNAADDEYLVSYQYDQQSSFNRDLKNVQVNRRMITTSALDIFENKEDEKKKKEKEDIRIRLAKRGFAALKGAFSKKEKKEDQPGRGGASMPTKNSRKETAQERLERKLPPQARWKLTPAPEGDNRYYIDNVATGEALYVCRHSALSYKTSYNVSDNTMDRRMVSTIKPNVNSDSGREDRPRDVWLLVEDQGFSIESYRRRTKAGPPNPLAGDVDWDHDSWDDDYQDQMD